MQQQQQQQQQGMLPRAPLCSEGKVIKGKWRIVRQIGMGAFGEIYIGQDVSTNEKVAVKVEVVDEKKQVLRAEVSIMRKLQSCSCVPRFIACGRQDNINFLVMQLLGENLSDLRKHQPGGTFSLPTICRLAIEITRAIQSIHAIGILHRDIKPSNFVLDMPVDSPKSEGRVYLYLIDFGLSRKYWGADGEIRPPRPNVGFRGTPRYASIYSHACMDLSPRDDLWSVFYMLVEFAAGSLPWSKVRDRDKVGEMKNQYMDGTALVDKLPEEFAEFQKYLKSLDYYATPNYEHVVKLFYGLLEKTTGSTAFLPFDWESSFIGSSSSDQLDSPFCPPSLENFNQQDQSPQSPPHQPPPLKSLPPLFMSSRRAKTPTAKSQDIPIGSTAVGMNLEDSGLESTTTTTTSSSSSSNSSSSSSSSSDSDSSTNTNKQKRNAGINPKKKASEEGQSGETKKKTKKDTNENDDGKNSSCCTLQ